MGKHSAQNLSNQPEVQISGNEDKLHFQMKKKKKKKSPVLSCIDNYLRVVLLSFIKIKASKCTNPLNYHLSFASRMFSWEDKYHHFDLLRMITSRSSTCNQTTTIVLDPVGKSNYHQNCLAAGLQSASAVLEGLLILCLHICFGELALILQLYTYLPLLDLKGIPGDWAHHPVSR